MVTSRKGSGWLANEDQNLGSFPASVFHRRRGARSRVPQTGLVNTGLFLQGCSKMRPLLSHLPRLRKLRSDLGAGMWTLGWEASSLLSCPFSLCALWGPPARVRPAKPPPHRPTSFTEQRRVWRPVSREGG